jgi:hypothetical protein
VTELSKREAKLRELEVQIAEKEKGWKERQDMMEKNASKVPSIIKMWRDICFPQNDTAGVQGILL